MGYQSLQQRLTPEILRTLAAASIVSSTANPAWAELATAGGVFGLSNPSRILLIQNLTEKTINYSWDGSVAATGGVSGNINLQLPPNSFWVIDEATNGTPQGAAFTATGTTFWAQYVNAGGAPAVGAVNVSSIYATGPII